jgi:hypothetical protein
MSDRVQMLCPRCGKVYSGEYTGAANEICLACALAPPVSVAQVPASQPAVDPQIRLPFEE